MHIMFIYTVKLAMYQQMLHISSNEGLRCNMVSCLEKQPDLQWFRNEKSMNLVSSGFMLSNVWP